MKRLFSDYIYGNGPRAGCWWDETCDLLETPRLKGDVACDVAVIGAGFTGLNAAIELARNGVDVAVFDSQFPGWGASGRNGGFCCVGGGLLSDADLDKRFGKPERLEWRQAERVAIEHVARFLDHTKTDADVHSEGETLLAHRPRHIRGFEKAAHSIEENYGVVPMVLSADDLDANGMSAGFFGGLTQPLGFALNPRKYIAALVQEALAQGVRLFSYASIRDLRLDTRGWSLVSDQGSAQAEQVLVATNAYSAENVPPSMRARFMPVQSSVIVTRPLSQSERDAQGWTRKQMSYDTRNLLHYFRLMPDNRMLFGMRGGLGGSAGSERRAQTRILQHFRKMFPAWAHVDITNYWSGMVGMTSQGMPFSGRLDSNQNLWSAMCYHGNGVAMGSWVGAVTAQAMLGNDTRPAALKTLPKRFPLGSWRRALMWPAYGFLKVGDI